MRAVGLPDFGPVQNNISFNSEVGTTRGVHAEPWDKFISIGAGRVFGAWVDLRRGSTFGSVFTAELDPSRAIFVPRGVGNAFQTLEPDTVYTYLVNDHWSAEALDQYAFLNLADQKVNIPWPIPLSQAQLSDKDRTHPSLSEVSPVAPKKTLVLGAGGQLGLAMRDALGDSLDVELANRPDFDLGRTPLDKLNWGDYSTIINAAAYTAVDAAETDEGRKDAWLANVWGVSELARIAREHRITLVHVSSDYVFDGRQLVHDEHEPFSPLGVYGQTKAAGDAVVATVPKHYIVRTSWVIGQGSNFVRTMMRLAVSGVYPVVVNDQIGRLTFASDLASAILHLLQSDAPSGTYNVTNSGHSRTWADIAAEVFELCGRDSSDVTGIATTDYFAGKPNTAPRPLNSTLDLQKIAAQGFQAPDMSQRLQEYVAAELGTGNF